MVETLLAMVLLLAMGSAAVALTAAADAVVLAGVWIVAVGLALGAPTGVAYHVFLQRSLRRVGALPPRWWLRPTALHDQIPSSDRGQVLAWFAAGAAGFGVTVFGLVVIASGAIRML